MVIKYSKTASFDVDAQKGFTPLCPDELPVPDGDKIASALNRQAAFAKFRVGSKDWHCKQALWLADDKNPQFSPIKGRNVDIRWNCHCIGGTKGAELLDGLPHPADYDFFVWKGMEPDMHPYGACFHDLDGRLSTGVIEFLHGNGVDTVIVGGLATDYCVKTTAMQLKRAGFNVVVNLEACRGISIDTIDAAISDMTKEGIVVLKNLNDLKVEK
ncbi:MAG TPA: nicotinamidase [Spirochaetota bacterium]|jgi:nicotinamidase/pyrazinamidase|nr:nicotinamidase [Spirochaetota bacterium]HOK91706.1 nicotinamidase [Spirochaetota bacterium]HON16304.1 nicotinamidase [Spirochaetota bacterium]HPD78908.1 nicotinamidase [Spirochaetota bacterium]HPP94476.1 nicotinamidase [Spirochaetota bacterium]